MGRLEVISKFLLALAASVFIFMSAIGVPPLGVILLPFVVQPVLMFGFKFGAAGGMALLGVAIVALIILAGEELALIYGIFAVMAAMLLSLLGWLRVIDHLVAGVAGVMLALTAAISWFFFGSWSAMFNDFRQGMTQKMAAAVRMQEKMGFPQDGIALLKERAPQIIDMLLQVLPALLLLSFAFIALVNILYLGRRYPEQRASWFTLTNLREWKGPEPLVWGLIACGFTLFVPAPGAARVVAANLLLVISAYYFAQGLAVIGFFFHKNKVPRFLRGLTYVLIVFQQIFTLLVVGLGLFDLWGDFRRLSKDNLTPNEAA
ncbi:MAG: DUF2232 domain-containing protein [Deltaproteobacteria bacterium]|nr:DUF2232 domain-containing protein [Deltaproteobacteria bacterium]